MRKVIKDAVIINEGQRIEGDLLIENDRIVKIGGIIEEPKAKELPIRGNYLFPGIIDDQVHFREPGLTHKAELYTESRAAIAGGTTSFMEMPNTKPPALTQELLQEKYDRAAEVSPANYSFFMGASNDNLDEVLKTNPSNVCGIKVFMGSSTGNMLVDDRDVLEGLFSQVPMLIATHCEDEMTIRGNLKSYKEKYGDEMSFDKHPEIRNAEACYKSSSMAVELAKKYNTRLHILHISTEEELALFTNEIPLEEKRITSEVCVHHLYFDASQYKDLGSKIKCNPAIKEKRNRIALFKALLDDRLDIIATDHAPHTREEKDNGYFSAPSGLPLVQHSLDIMMDFVKKGQISIENVIRKMCHAPAKCFKVRERGYIREGYFADLIVYNPKLSYTVSADNILYKCGWSPLEGKTFEGKVQHVLVNGELALYNGQINNSIRGKRLEFNH